jgi:hypothetical protein
MTTGSRVTLYVRHSRSVLGPTSTLTVVSAVESVDDDVLKLLEKAHTRQDFVDVVPACVQPLLVEAPVLLHVRQGDHQVERRSGEHLVDVREVIRHVVFGSPPLGALVDDVAGADELDVPRLGQVGEVLAGHAAAADDADADLLLLRERDAFQRRKQAGGAGHRGALEELLT